jgi:hypothetical protein
VTNCIVRAVSLSVTVGCLLLPVSPAAAAAPAPPGEDLMAGPPQGPWRRLFLDVMVVEQQSGLRRIFHAAEKYVDNPILKADNPWEGDAQRGGPILYGTVMWDDGRLRMWYLCHRGGGKWTNCYAESADGIHWTKPSLGLIEFRGSKDNNIWDMTSEDSNDHRPEAQPKVHIASVIKRPGERDPAKRYVLYCHSPAYRHNLVAFSPDGLRWTFVPDAVKKGLFSSSDVQHYFFDPYNRQYVATWKSSNRRGRAVGIAESTDGLKWSKPVNGPVLVADDLDPDATQIYGMPVFPYQGMYVGLAWIYGARWFKCGSYSAEAMHEAENDSPCTMDAQLAWSWDRVNWTREPQRGQFIPRGAPGKFDGGMIWTARAPVQIGDQLCFYYGGVSGRHNQFYQSKLGIGLATLRLDGFCSMQAGADEGWLISRRERFETPHVTINAKTATDGFVVAEILDKNNRPLPGFSRDDCVAFRGDNLRHALQWRTGSLPESARTTEKKLRFYLKNADLYSYLVLLK